MCGRRICTLCVCTLSVYCVLGCVCALVVSVCAACTVLCHLALCVCVCAHVLCGVAWRAWRAWRGVAWRGVALHEATPKTAPNFSRWLYVAVACPEC